MAHASSALVQLAGLPFDDVPLSTISVHLVSREVTICPPALSRSVGADMAYSQDQSQD